MTHLTEVVDFNETWYSTADEPDRELFRSWLISMLRTTDVTVTFKKTNGDLRVMNCTLRSDVIPNVDPKENAVLCTVWDLEKNAWRSFRFDHVTNIDFTLK